MGDPFSIATGVAGLVSLGITVCDGLHKYFSAIKDRKDDLAIVTQNLALFKFHIFAVQSSASKLGHHHSPAIYGLRLSLINCEMQLKCLDTLLNELRPTKNLSLTKEVWRKQKLMARYPFDRKKLVQLQEYLSRANTTLSSFIQALNFDINIRTGDELEAFRTSLEALHINTQTAMRTITTKLDVIGPKVEPSTLQLLPSKIEDITTSSSKSTVLHQAAVGVAETRICDLGNRRSIQDRANVHSKPRYLQNSELERRLCEKLADMDCTCGTSNSKSSHRLASRTYRFWGGLTVSRRGDVRANHRPGCIFFQRSQKDIWRTSVTYFGLLSLFSESFTISLTQEYPGGPYGISFGLQPCNIVDSSPALRLFDLHPQGNGNIFHKYANVNDLLADNVIKELRDIYESGNASPFDIDQNGNNVAHECLEACLANFRFEEPLKFDSIRIDAICKMLSYLADIGVPIMASNFNHSNLLTLSMKYNYLWILPRLYNMVTIHDSSFYDTELAHKGPDFFYVPRAFQRQLDIFCKYPEICEDIGFSELFLAVITKDYPRLEAVLAAEDSVSNFSQTDSYGRNILHASCNWPDGLRLLLQQQEAPPLLDKVLELFILLSPLDYALSYSKIYCNAPDQWTDCEGCTCYVAVQLLLEADCKVIIAQERLDSLALCSLKARKLFFKHLKDRRQRLRDVALSVLPEEVLRQYGVATNLLPDKTAVKLWSELQKAQDEQDRRVWLPDSLSPCDIGSSFIPKSIFQFPHHLQVTELALDYGFTPRDENGVQVLLSGSNVIPYQLSRSLEFIKYLDWLLRHNLSTERSSKPFQFSVLHRIASFIGVLMFFKDSKTSNLMQWDASISELRDSRTLLPAICGNISQCNIPCPCSSGVFTRPLAHILPAMLPDRHDGQSRCFFSSIREHIELVVSCIHLLKLSECNSEYLYMAKCAIHILTMMSLGVRHLPICLTLNFHDLYDSDNPNDLYDEEEWRELLGEDRELINQLEALDEEFGSVFDRQNVSIADFLSGYWLTRMREVLRELNKPLTDDDKYEFLEAGVVLDKDETIGPECRAEWTE